MLGICSGQRHSIEVYGMKRFLMVVMGFVFAFLFLICAFLISIGNAPKRVVEEMKLHISEAAQFVDEYSEELDVLLDIQSSLEENKRYEFTGQLIRIYGEDWEAIYEGDISKCTDFSETEKLVLEGILSNIDEGMSISPAAVTIYFSSYNHAGLMCISNSADGKPNYREQLNEIWFVELYYRLPA